MNITVDFTKPTGRIKPMHGVGQPPMAVGTANDIYFHYLEEAGIPYSRLHDTGGRYGAGVYVDIPNIFRDFDADPDDPRSYDFRSTDKLLTDLTRHGVEPFYRLGVTIENDSALCAYRISPPKDFHKWAAVCEHIVAHYNEGWAGGYRLGITYWEVWNEPDVILDDGTSFMWLGTAEQFYSLYTVTARRLKEHFGNSIKIGGYGCGGFYAIHPANADSRMHRYFITFLKGFLEHVRKEKAPLDFLSWHCYSSPSSTLDYVRCCRSILEEYGFGDIEDILDEWNPCTDERRFSNYAASQVLSMMLALQKEKTAVLTYYDAALGTTEYAGLFSADTRRPFPAYFAFMMFNRLYRLKTEVFSCSDEKGIYTGAAANNGRKVLLIANSTGDPVTARLEVVGADPGDAEILAIDSIYTYSPTGKRIKDGVLTLSPYSCTEIRF